MSGVIVAMRRTLLSCTTLARNGLIALGASVASIVPARADEFAFTHAISSYLDLNHQEFAALPTSLALLGFSVLAAILLMHTRVRAAKSEARLRSDIGELQVHADRLRALLFAEPQILISWAAGDNRPEISGDTSLLMPQEFQQPQRILAFGTWLPPEPALQMDHAVDALREAGEGFLLNLSTSNGRAIEAMGRAIGGQAIVRIRTRRTAPRTRRIKPPPPAPAQSVPWAAPSGYKPLSGFELGGLRRELAESTLRYKTLQEETELL